MKRKLLSLILTLSWASCPAFAADYPVETPFAERYPIDSITSEKRAHEVIEAYEQEKGLWDEWKKTQEKGCYRSFFVNDCLSGVKSDYSEHVYKARKVWLAARDFLRAEKTKEAQARRRSAEQRVAEREKMKQDQPSQRPALVNPDQPIEDEIVVTDRTKEVVQPKETARRQTAPRETVQQRQLTAQQERENEREFAKKQEAREQRRVEQEKKIAPEPGKTLEERVAERAQRRAEAEQKRLANIKKRQQKAAEYERQQKLREEQQGNSVLKDIAP